MEFLTGFTYRVTDEKILVQGKWHIKEHVI
jgi:hypothetical protein